jgi:hypothetical protein
MYLLAYRRRKEKDALFRMATTSFDTLEEAQEWLRTEEYPSRKCGIIWQIILAPHKD